MPSSTAQDPGRVVRLSTVACGVLAVVLVVVVSLLGRPADGAFVAAGVVVGATNAHMTQRLMALGVPFVATSMLRILTLTAVAGVIGIVGGLGHVFLVIAGVGIAQLVVAGSALRELARR